MSNSFKARDKILVHLLGYKQSRDNYTQPVEVTQGGMSERLDLKQNTISYALSNLTESGLVEEEVSRVRGKKQRMKTYSITEEGIKEAEETRKEMRESLVDLDVYGEEREVKAKNVNEYVHSDLDLLDIILRRESGVIKIRVGGDEGSPVLHRPGLPITEPPERIDLTELEEWYRNREGPGILKRVSPYQLASFTKKFEENTNIFYFQVEDHKEPIDLWEALSRFLEEIGKINLSTYRDFSEWMNPRTALEKLKADLKYTSALLIFDHVDNKEGLREMILKITEEVIEYQHVRTLVTLQDENHGEIPETANILNVSEKPSLYLKKLTESDEALDLERILSRELSLELSLALDYLSIFRFPVEKQELQRIGAIDEESLEKILDSPLIFETDEDKITLPIEIRQKKKGMISDTTRKNLHGLAAKYYEEKDDPSSRETLERFYHLIRSGEKDKAESLLEEFGSVIISDGYSAVLFKLLLEIKEEISDPLIDFYETEALRANREFEKSRERYEELLNETDERRWELKSYLGLGKVEEKLGEYDKAIHNLNRAEDVAKTLEKEPGTEDYLGKIYARRGEIWHKNDNYQNAKEDLKKAIQTLVHEEDHHLLTSSYFILARMEKERGKEEDAIEPFKMGLKSWSKLDDSYGSTRGERETGTLYKVLRELEDAEIRFRTQFQADRAGPIQEEYEDLKTAALLSLAECHMENGSYEKAIKSAKDAKESILSEDKRERAFTEALLGKAYLETGREVKAEDHLSKAISLYKELGQQYQLGLTYFSMAKVHERNDNSERMAENYRKAVLSLSKSGAEQKAEKVKREMESIPISL